MVEKNIYCLECGLKWPGLSKNKLCGLCEAVERNKQGDIGKWL